MGIKNSSDLPPISETYSFLWLRELPRPRIISNIKAAIYGKKSKQRHKRVAASTCLFKANNEKLLA